MSKRDMVSWTTLIVGYIHNVHIEEALALFYKMLERNVVSWNAMILGLEQSGYYCETFIFFQNMQLKDVIPYYDTYTNILYYCVNLVALSQGKIIHQDIIRNGFVMNFDWLMINGDIIYFFFFPKKDLLMCYVFY